MKLNSNSHQGYKMYGWLKVLKFSLKAPDNNAILKIIHYCKLLSSEVK